MFFITLIPISILKDRFEVESFFFIDDEKISSVAGVTVLIVEEVDEKKKLGNVSFRNDVGMRRKVRKGEHVWGIDSKLR